MCQTSDMYVLVIDSDEDSKKDMCDALNELGLNRLVCASDGKEAFGYLEEADHSNTLFNFVFCNWDLGGGMSGSQLISSLWKAYPTITSIMYSSCDRPEIHINSLMIGSMEFIDKGQSSFKKELFEKVGKWIELEKLKIDYRENFHGQQSA